MNEEDAAVALQCLQARITISGESGIGEAVKVPHRDIDDKRAKHKHGAQAMYESTSFLDCEDPLFCPHLIEVVTGKTIPAVNGRARAQSCKTLALYPTPAPSGLRINHLLEA
jgi:hypothetical protein